MISFSKTNKKEYFVSDDHYVEPLVWPFGETRPEVTVLHVREKKGNRKARRLTKDDGCYVLKWELDSTFFIGEIFNHILIYLMDEFLSIERMIETFDSMCTVYGVLATPRDMRDLRSGEDKLGFSKVTSFVHHGAKATYFRSLTAEYLRQRYKPHVMSRNFKREPEERFNAEWWTNDKVFLDLLFHSRSFCVDCFQYLPLHVYERPAGPGTQVWQAPINNDLKYEPPSGVFNSPAPGRIQFVTDMLKNPEALFNHLLGGSNDFMQYDPLWRGEPSYEDLLHSAAFLPPYLGGVENPNPMEAESRVRQKQSCAFERNRDGTAHPVAPPRCFRCLNRRYPMVDIPNAWGLLTETITKAFAVDDEGVTEDEGTISLCETLMDVLPDDMLYALKLSGKSKNGKTACAPSDRLWRGGFFTPPKHHHSSEFLKKDRNRNILDKALTDSIEKGEPGQDFDSVYSGSFGMGVFDSCITSMNPPIDGLNKNGGFDPRQVPFHNKYIAGNDFHYVLLEITESFLWHVNKKVGPTLDPWGPPGTHGYVAPGTAHSCSAHTWHHSFHPRNGDRKLFETKADFNDDSAPRLVSAHKERIEAMRSIPEDEESSLTMKEEKLAAYQENHPPLAWPFCDHVSMRSNHGAVLQYVLLKLLCLLPYKRMVAPRSVHKRSGFGNSLVGQRTKLNPHSYFSEGPFIEHHNSQLQTYRMNHSLRGNQLFDVDVRDENSSRSVGPSANKGMDAIYKKRYQPKGWERLGWFYRLNADVDPTCRSPTRLKLLRGCPASYAESDIHMDRLSFMPPSQLCRIMDLKKDILPALKRQLEESQPRFKTPKPTPYSFAPLKQDLSYMFSGAEWARYDKDCRQNGSAVGGMAVPQKRHLYHDNIGMMLNGKELPVILEADVLLLAKLFIEFIREFQAGDQTLTWASFEKRVSEAFFNMWMGPDRVPCSAISVTKNGYPQTFLSQFQTDGVWRYGDDIRHRLWYGCIGIHNPFEENLNPLGAYVYSAKGAKRAAKLDNGLRTETYTSLDSEGSAQRTMIFCNKYTKLGMVPLRRCLGSFRLQSEPSREISPQNDGQLVTVYGGANVYQLRLEGSSDCEIGMEEAVPINSKLTKEAKAYAMWHKRDVSENHYRSGRNVNLFWNTEFEDEEKEEGPAYPEGIETPDKGNLKKVATPDAPVRPSTHSVQGSWTTPKKAKKRKSWREVQDRLGKKWLKRVKKQKAAFCPAGCDCPLCTTEKESKN